jgi:hypothetical protein
VVSNTQGNATSTVATLTVLGVSVSLTPASASLTVGGTQSFTATVTGSTTQTVTWSVQEAGGGSITSAGLYTAPATAGTYHVLATSAVPGATQGSATVTVTGGGGGTTHASIGSFTANPTTIAAGGSALLTWSVTNATSIFLSGSNVSASGSQSVSPSATTSYTLTATGSDGVPVAQTVTVMVSSGTPPPIPAGQLEIPNLDNYIQGKAKFTEGLKYEGSDTGLITGVEVTRQLQAEVAAMATGKDRATHSTYSYGYDPLGQLVKADGAFYTDPTKATSVFTDLTAYAYDKHGNRQLAPTIPAGASPRSSWSYGYKTGTNQLITTTGDYASFAYTEDGAVREIVKNGNTQTLTYDDPRFMRLPTQMNRVTPDGRIVASTLRYDMSGTRVYKRDNVTQAGGVVSDRETIYLANGTEVLMEVEKKGPSANAVASERHTAFIFGAGSRLARLSWDADGRPAILASRTLPLPNGNFEAGVTGWVGSGFLAAAARC